MCVVPINQHSGQEKLTAAIAESLAIAQKIEDDSLAMLCAICSQPRGSHSHDRDECPNLGAGQQLFQASKFKELRCEANIVRGLDSFGYECRAACIPGTRYCTEHSLEA